MKSHYTKALEEGERELEGLLFEYGYNRFDERGLAIEADEAEEKIKSYLTSFAEKIRKAVAEDEYKLLEDYSEWLHKHSYLDSDYYTEEPKAIDAFIIHKREQLTKK